MAPRSWSEWLASVVVLGVVAICAFGAGSAFKTYAINDKQKQIDKLQMENENLREVVERDQDVKKALDEKLAAADSQFKDAFNAYRAIVLHGHETTYVSTGHFSVGLVETAANERVSININGTRHTVAAGDSIDVGASTCRVEVKSFDMFTVTLLTSCTPTKP